MRKKPSLLLSLSSSYIIKKTSYNTVLARTHTSTQAPTCRRLQPYLILQHPLEGSSNPLIKFTNTHWKGAPTPSSHLLAPIGRELHPLDMIYQLPLEGSFNFLIEGSNPQHFCGPRFINFHIGST